MRAPRRRRLARLVAAGLLAAAGAAGARPASAATPEQTFDSGNAAYQEGKFEQAAAAYESIRSHGIDDARVEYNLGNAYFKLGKLGAAILHYERALRLDPADDDARDNLAFARGRIRDTVPDPDLQYPIRVVRDLLDRIPADTIAWSFLAVWALTAALAAAVPLQRSWARRRLLAYAACALGLLSLAAGTVLLYRARLDADPVAIVQAEKVDVKSGPGEENTVLFSVHEGTRVEVRNGLDRWLQVSLPNGLTGWVPSSAVEKV